MKTVIDFHIHGKITNSFHFDATNFVNIIHEARYEKIDYIAIIEHAHSKNFSEAYEYLESKYLYNGEFYLVDEIKVFVGVEITTADGHDVIFVDNQKEVLHLQNKCPDKTKTLAELLKLFNDTAIVILAHPYRKQNKISLAKDMIERIDAIEINARDLFEKGVEINKVQVEALSKELKKPAIGGSDSHQFMQIGSIKTILNKNADSIKAIKSLIHQRKFTVETSSDLALRVRCAQVIKKAIVTV